MSPRARLILIFAAPLPLLALPGLCLDLHSSFNPAWFKTASDVVIYPGITGMFLGLMVGVRSALPIVIFGGVFWYLAGAALFAALFSPSRRITRGILVPFSLMFAAVLYTLAMTWNWNPD